MKQLKKIATASVETPEGQTATLAVALRRLRTAAGMTLRELGLRSGIAFTTLSKIENGHLSPTYEKIMALADALGADVAELFSGNEGAVANGRRGVCRRGQGLLHSTTQYDYELLCPDLSHKQFVPLVTTLKAHDVTDFPTLLKHHGEEFIYVLEGRVKVHSEFYEPLELQPGDSCYFDSTMGHAAVSAGAKDAKILWVCSKNTPLPIPNRKQPRDK